MPTFKCDPNTGSFSFETTEADLLLLLSFFRPKHGDTYINYSPDAALEAYQDSDLTLVQNRNGTICVPYQVLLDYRTSTAPLNWGTVSFADERYAFPGALARHRTAMVSAFQHRKLLSKGNQPAPRVKRFDIQGRTPHFLLQEAHYYDQVGTNLSIDHPFAEPVMARDLECRSVREWDIVQSQGESKRLPKFEESKLANTLGVAIGLSARSRDGQTHWLRRRRSKSVAVYAGLWHVPFSFALCMDEEGRKATDLRSLIRFDLAHERAEELGGLEHSDFGELKPIAFCRDLARGGKPQLFLELPCLVPFEQLRCEAQESTATPEFSSRIEVVPYQREQQLYSSELACFLLLAENAG